MQPTYAAIVKRDQGVWIGWVEEVPGMNCQEAARGELLESLRAVLAEAIELNRADARGAVGESPVKATRNCLSRYEGEVAGGCAATIQCQRRSLPALCGHADLPLYGCAG